MAIDPRLLEILVCPDTRRPLALLDAERLARFNALVEAGSVKYRNGEPVDHAFEAALVTDDGATIYEVRQDIPILLVEKGVPTAGLEGLG